MPRYAVDFIADIEELNDSPTSALEEYPKSETKAENYESGTAMGNVQCLFAIGERQRNRRVVVSRGTQMERTAEPQFTSIRQENISTVRGHPLESDYTSQFFPTTLHCSTPSIGSNGQQEEVIMGRLSSETSSKLPPDLKDSDRLKSKREQLLQKLSIDVTEDEPDSLSDTLSNTDLKYEFQDPILHPSQFYKQKTSKKAGAVELDVCVNAEEGRNKENSTDVIVVDDEVSFEFDKRKSRLKRETSADFTGGFKMTERGDSDAMLDHLCEDVESVPYLNASFPYCQTSANSNVSNTKSSSMYNQPVRSSSRRKAHHTSRKKKRDSSKSKRSELNQTNAISPPGENHTRLKMTEAIPLTDLPPKPPRAQPTTLNCQQPGRSHNVQQQQLHTLSNQSNMIDVPSSPIEAVIEHNIVAQGDYDLDSPSINPPRSPRPRTFSLGDYCSGIRSRSHSEPRNMSPRGFYYPSRIPQPVTQKFYVSESDGIGNILADTTDRRIKAVCDRHRCDIAIYSPIVRGGYKKYIVMLTAPSASEMKKCVRSLDTTLKWNLSSQLK